MKKHLLTYSLTILTILSIGQNKNMGIGISQPQVALDVLRSIRVGGIKANSNYLFFDSASGNFSWNNSFLFVPATQALIRHSDATPEGLYYNSAKLEYRNNLNDLKFYTQWNTGNTFVGNNLGIGRIDPASPIHLSNALGEKIIFWGDTNKNYGIGIQPSQLQIHNDDYPSSIVFGYGSGSSFTENMRIVGTGQVGIGTNSPQARLEVRKGANNATALFGNSFNPAYDSYFNTSTTENTYLNGYNIILNDILGGKVGVGVEPFITDGVLDVGGRALIRSGGDLLTSAGTWLNDLNNGLVAFVGMENDNYVGFYGGTSWKFGMNTQNGALKINGSTGTPGQVLQANNGSAPTWVSPTKGLSASTFTFTNTSLSLDGTSTPVDVPGLSGSVTVGAGGADLLVRYMLRSYRSSPYSGNVTVYIDVLYDNSLYSRNIHDTYNLFNGATGLIGTILIHANAGVHPIKIMASSVGANVEILTNNSFYRSPGLTIQVLNQ